MILTAAIDIKPSSTIVICAKRNEGKSVLAKHLLHRLVQQQKVDVVYLFSPTETLSHSFDCLPKVCVVNTFDLKFIEKVLSAQEKAIRKTKLGKDDPAIAQILFIFDDMLASVVFSAEKRLCLILASTAYNVHLLNSRSREVEALLRQPAMPATPTAAFP